RPPVSGRPYKTNAKAPSTLPARASYALRLYSTGVEPLEPSLSLSYPAVSSCSHLPNRAAIPCFVAVTNCQRSSAMSCELNQSAECPEVPDAGKRYTASVGGQRPFFRQDRRNPRHARQTSRIRAAGYLQRSDSAWRIPSVPSEQHDKTMTFPAARSGFAFAAKPDKFEVRLAAL